MLSWKQVAVAAIVIVVSMGTGVAVARQATAPGDEPAQPEASTSIIIPQIGGDLTESKYVPITPCRIVDTRKAGGQIGKNATRTFYVRGTSNFAAQGGTSGGCDIPYGAMAAEIAVTAVDPAGGGYLRIYPSNESEPTATFLNYASFNPTNTGAVTLCDTVCTGDLKVTSHNNATHLVMDVQGYYTRPMAADISDNGGVNRASRLSSVDHSSTGIYYLTWDRDVSECTSYASAYYNGQEINAVQSISDGRTLVVTRDTSTTTTENARFVVEVVC